MRYVVLFIFTLLSPGCTSSWYLGVWEVTDARFPGISAMGLEEARTWFGSKAVYSNSKVTFRGERCEAPQFKLESLTEENFRSEYKAAFTDLGIESTSAEILEVRCPSRWIVPASAFIKVNADTGYIVWDGVFFKLEKTAAGVN